MEPVVGVEPTTYGLQNRCSTTELNWQPQYRRRNRDAVQARFDAICRRSGARSDRQKSATPPAYICRYLLCMETILVVDDESSMRQPLCIALRSKGFLVLEADNCRDGVQTAKTRKPDLIVCDINLADGTGHDVFDALKGNGATSTIPFIFMTGNNDPDELRRSMEQGADDFLSKPFPILTFLAVSRGAAASRRDAARPRRANRETVAGDCRGQPRHGCDG